MTDKLILYIDHKQPSRIVKGMFAENDKFAGIYVLSEKARNDGITQYPTIEFRDRQIVGLDDIYDMINQIVKGKSLDEVFQFEGDYKSDRTRLVYREKLALGLGFIGGGIWIHFIGSALGLTSFIGNLIAVLVPIILTLAWPYIWPEVKSNLKNVRFKSHSEMDEQNKM
jgi:hypothetical protein